MKSSIEFSRAFVSRLNIGGPAIHVLNLSTGLTDRGYETTLVVGSPARTEGNLEAWAPGQGANLLVLPTFQAALSIPKDFRALLSLISLFWTERPHMVKAHSLRSRGLLGRIAAWLVGTPVIVHTYHGHLLGGYWGRMGRASSGAWKRHWAGFSGFSSWRYRSGRRRLGAGGHMPAP